MNNPVTAVIVGAGHRAMKYASYAKERPEELRIVGVADPNPLRRAQARAAFNLPADACFDHAEALAERPQMADAVINGTMDHQHVATMLPLLEAGYHALLEKPIATSEAELMALVRAVREHRRTVLVCHVLRYAPFYTRIRERVAEGAIGDLISVRTIEHVSYHHMAVGFVRGKWNSAAGALSSMLMAKCCHDLDLVAWMKSGVRPTAVASLGGLMYFRPERAPDGAGTRCLVDCPIEADCLYSARKHYIDHPDRWSFYVWDSLEHLSNPTLEDKIASLEGDNPYGRCVWKCDNDVVDHQTVSVEFEDGATASHDMIGGTAKPSRMMHLVGTKGEIEGSIEGSRFCIRHVDPRPGCEYSEEVVDLNVTGDMHGAFGGHGGGDLRLVADFLRVVRGESPSICSTHLEDSVNGHLIGFRADAAREQGCVMTIPEDGASSP
jgi:predicted dehydrogenase